MSEATYYQRNRSVILKRAKDYYENNEEILTERAKNKYRELSKEEKEVKRKYQINMYHNMFDEKKQELKEYRKTYREAKKTTT